MITVLTSKDILSVLLDTFLPTHTCPSLHWVFISWYGHCKSRGHHSVSSFLRTKKESKAKQNLAVHASQTSPKQNLFVMVSHMFHLVTCVTKFQHLLSSWVVTSESFSIRYSLLFFLIKFVIFVGHFYVLAKFCHPPKF